MKILTAEEMRACDRATAEQYGVSLTRLMVHAGEAVARFVAAEFPEARNIVVLCGKGNNGGDGLMASAALAEAGLKPHVLLLGRKEELKGDPEAMFDRSQPLVPVTEIPTEAELHTEAVARLFAGADLILDAMVGTGFKPPMRGVLSAVRDLVNPMLPTPIVAVDLPSGWDADSLAYEEQGVVRADAVVTFTAPKLAHAFGNLTGSATRPIVIANIGSPDEAIVSGQQLRWTGSAKWITERPRKADDNKGRHGHVVLFAGSHGKAGAPSMASLAGLRAGAGLVTAAVPASVLNTVALVAPELMTEPLPEDAQAQLDTSFFNAPGQDALAALLKKKSVIAVGPGLGESEQAAGLVWALVERAEVPLVLDADALNLVAKDMPRFRERANRDGQRVVMTPHPGEMARLAGMSIAEVQKDRIGLARRFAMEYGVTLVLKGWRTLVAHPDGMVAVNTTGNPGLAKGGSGDMLTGIVAAFVAQYPDKLELAVEAAVFMHGLAADIAVRAQDEHTLLVTDVLQNLWKAFRYRTEAKGGYVWWEGLPK
ncbi:NAD(P)H-hydrate dehydratase [Acidipila sp. EB88]|uniref:NAD(P)H-hydrate dehydratase n=1 Tax=Acidipila sp. EB88 TaxID=2305226 RepID=UPI000F5DDFF0|nr:NAD(P)H-hydrate dehydratase [Acidipila sp. EB88]RRA48881.1 NAD(P)H-hydrate dehydratase [Acidipila sp. EB88]